MARKKSFMYKMGFAAILAIVAIYSGLYFTSASSDKWTDHANTDWYDPIYASFTIDTPEKLAGVAELVNNVDLVDGVPVDGLAGKVLQIDRDLDLSAHEWVPIGTGVKPFKGTLITQDGIVKQISGMKLTADTMYAGFVGYMDGATVGGFEFTDTGSIDISSVTQAVYAGTAVGYMKNLSTVYDITSRLPVKVASTGHDSFVGGIVGKGEGTISNSANAATVEAKATSGGNAFVGGVVGYGEAPIGLKLKRVTNEGGLKAESDDNGDAYAGGIAGYGLGALLLNEDATPIANAGSVTVLSGRLNYAGGMVGYAGSEVKFSTNTTSAGEVAIDAQTSVGSYAGGLVGAIGAEQANPIFDVGFVHSADVKNNGGANAYTGGMAGFVNSAFTWVRAYTNQVSITAAGSSQLHTGGLIGAASGTVRFLDEAKNVGLIQVSGGTLPARPDEAYTGGLIGSSDSRLLFESGTALAYGNSGNIQVSGGNGLYTGGIAGNVAYARTTGEPSENVFSTGTIQVSGGGKLHTGGYIGTVSAEAIDRTVSGATFASTISVAASGSVPGQTVSTGGIVGYSANAVVNDSSFKGTIQSAGGGVDTYTGGIVGTANGGTIARSSVGGTQAANAAISTDGSVGGVVGRLVEDGTIATASVTFVSLTVQTAEGFAGGVAAKAQGTIQGAVVGVADSADDDTVKLIAAVAGMPNGGDRLTAGGIVGANDGRLSILGSLVTNIELANATGRTGYTLGGVAGALTSDAVIGESGAPVRIVSLVAEANANEAVIGGAVGYNASPKVFVSIEDSAFTANAVEAKIGGVAGVQAASVTEPAGGTPDLAVKDSNFDVPATGASVGGLYGENRGSTQRGLAENLTINAAGASVKIGGIAGLNIGALRDSEARNVTLSASGAASEAGGIAGRSETIGNTRASITDVKANASADPIITAKPTSSDAKIGGIVGFASATDIVRPAVTTVTSGDYAMLIVQAPQVSAGGIAGRTEHGTITGTGYATNIANLYISTTGTPNATAIYAGGFVGYNLETRIERIVSEKTNMILNGGSPVTGGMTGYNLSSASAYLANNYASDLYIRANASAAQATVGGMLGVNDKQASDPSAAPATAVSTLQNNRIVGEIDVRSPNAVTGGMVGENRSLIANNSIPDKIDVISKGNSGIVGGLAGVNAASGTLYYTYSNADLTIEGSGTLGGGLVGYNNQGKVVASYIDIDVTGSAIGAAGNPVYLGGLVGRNTGTIDRSYSNSKVKAVGGYTNVGGLVGDQVAGAITNSYSGGEVIAAGQQSYVGGFLGRIANGAVSTVYSAGQATAAHASAFAGGFAGRYDNASKELLTKAYYLKDEDKLINKDLPDFAEGNHRWLNVHARLSTILVEALADREYFKTLSGWDFAETWRYASTNAVYKYPELYRHANSGGGGGTEVNANINWYMRDPGAINFEIRTEAELAGLAAIVNGTFPGVEKFNFQDRTIRVANPIHIQSNQWTPIGDSEANAFQGYFEGNKHLIDGLTVIESYPYAGLFGVIGEEAVVNDIVLEPLAVAGEQAAGVLAGFNKGAVSNVEVKLLNGVTISGGTVGGLLGINTGVLTNLVLRMEEGSRVEAAGALAVVGGVIGDNSGDLLPGQFRLVSTGGSVGSAAANATVGGIIGKQKGDYRDFNVDIVPDYIVSATGESNIVGGYIGQYVSGFAERGTVTFRGGTLQASGAGSTLGSFAGVSDSGNVIRQVTVTSAVPGPHLTGNGTIGGIVGAKTGRGDNTFDLEQLSIANVSFAAVPNSPQATIGGIVGTMTDTALRDAMFEATVSAVADEVVAGGIVGEARDSILYRVDVLSDISITSKTGESAIGGIAGIVGTSDAGGINARFDFGGTIPFYPGIYDAAVHTKEMKAAGVGHGGDLYVGGIAGRNESASIYNAQATAKLTANGGKIVAVGGIAGFTNGIIVGSAALQPIRVDDSRVYHVGGVAGQVAGGEVHYTYSTSPEGAPIVVGSAVTKPGLAPAAHVGGFAGKADDTVFADVYTDREIRLDDNNQDNTIYAGGFAGMMGDETGPSGTVRRAYALGDVKVSGITGSIVGGFTGSVDRYDIEEAYSSGSVFNTGFDIRSGGFAGESERGAEIRRAYAAPASISATGVNHATRAYVGGFVGFNDGTLDEVFANVGMLESTVSGANAYKGGLVGYNFRDGKVLSSSYTRVGPAAGHNLGSIDAAQADSTSEYAAFSEWYFELDSSLFGADEVSGFVVQSARQLAATVKLHNEDTGLKYFRLFDRTAAAKPVIAALSLGADIDMTGIAWIPFDEFTGTLDGKGFKVTGLKTAATATAPEALGFIAENRGTIENVELHAAFSGGANVGTAAGVNHAGAVIRNVAVKAELQGAGNVGGIAGTNEGRIEKSYVRGAIEANVELAGAPVAVGGIAGINRASGSITESFSYADTSASTNEAASGGIAGVNEGAIEYVYSAGAVKATGASKAWAGGIAGRAVNGTIRQALNTGAVSANANGVLAIGKTYYGGIAGSKEAAAIISEAVFNRQMLKNNTAYFLVDGTRAVGTEPGAAGRLARELAAGTLPQGFDGSVWQAVQGAYPELKVFAGTTASKLSAAAIVLADRDTVHRIGNDFELAGETAVSWTSSADAAIRNADGKRMGTLLTTGAARLTATLDGESRAIVLNVAAAKYEAAAVVPTADPDGSQSFSDRVSVTLSTTEPTGKIYYTLDGTEPDETAAIYAEPIVLTETTTLKAVSMAEGKEISLPLSVVFKKQAPSGGFGGGVFIPPVKEEPAIGASIGKQPLSTEAGEAAVVPRNSKLTLTAPAGQTIYYTIDGSTPTTESKRYTGEIVITGKMTVKVITDQSDEVVTFEYEVEPAKYEIRSDAHRIKYIDGYPSGEFRPGAAITRYELLGALAPLLNKEEVTVANPFGDVRADSEELVAFFVSAGIITGYPDQTFGGERGLTRAEFVVILTRLLKLDLTNTGKTAFADLAGHWSQKYVNALTKSGFVKGFPDGTFKPMNIISRAEAVVLINRIIGKQRANGVAVTFSDLPPTHWAFREIMAAAE